MRADSRDRRGVSAYLPNLGIFPSFYSLPSSVAAGFVHLNLNRPSDQLSPRTPAVIFDLDVRAHASLTRPPNFLRHQYVFPRTAPTTRSRTHKSRATSCNSFPCHTYKMGLL
jgi:hypothetical protein